LILPNYLSKLQDGSRRKNKISLKDTISNVPAADYEKAESDLLKDALNRYYTERFLMTTWLYKIQRTLNKAKIIHKSYNLNK